MKLKIGITMKNKTAVLAQLSLSMSEKLFNEMGTLPPNLAIFCKDKVINLFFDSMETTEQKYEISFICMLLTYWLDDVQCVAFNSEAWALDISPENTPALWKRFDGKYNKIMGYIFKKYGDIEHCPWRHEILMTSIDDGKIAYLLKSNIQRDGDKVTISADTSVMQPQNNDGDIRNRFNSLMYKSQLLGASIESYTRLTEASEPDATDFDRLKYVIDGLKNKFDISFDTCKVIKIAQDIFESSCLGKTSHTIH